MYVRTRTSRLQGPARVDSWAQVVISFLLSAYSTLVLVGVHFLIEAHGPDNPLDRTLRRALLPKAFRARQRDSLERWSRAVESTILAFSDTQLVTSLAILVSGYLQLSCGLSLYHWQMVVNLAWFSAITHLTTLTSLKRYFRSYPFMATCRIFVMGMVLILLSVAFIPTGYAWQLPPYARIDPANPSYTTYTYFVSSPAVCLYSRASKDAVISQVDQSALGLESYQSNEAGHSYNAPLVAMSLTYLLSSFGSRVIRISTPLALRFESWLKVRPSNFLQRRYQSAKKRQQVPCNRVFLHCYKALLLVVMTFLEAFYETGNSMVWEMVWLSAALAWGTLRLIGLRSPFRIADEDRWAFGQVLPLVLSVLPIWWLFTLSCDRRPPTSATASQPRNTKSFPTMREIKKAKWFRSLTSLIIGMLTVLAMYLLADLPGAFFGIGPGAGVDSLATAEGFAFTFVKYVFASMFCVIVWTIFVCACLAFHFRMVKVSQPENACPEAVKVRGRRRLHNGLCGVTIVTILVLQIAFIITGLIRPGWLIQALILAWP